MNGFGKLKGPQVIECDVYAHVKGTTSHIINRTQLMVFRRLSGVRFTDHSGNVVSPDEVLKGLVGYYI